MDYGALLFIYTNLHCGLYIKVVIGIYAAILGWPVPSLICYILYIDERISHYSIYVLINR